MSLTSSLKINSDQKTEVMTEKNSKADFEENLDIHFDRKRIELQAEILRKKEKKERASQQNIRPSTTTAYEPI